MLTPRTKRTPRAHQAPDDAQARVEHALHNPSVGGDRNSEAREFQAYKLHVLGYTYKEIATSCGWKAHTSAMRAVAKVRHQVLIEDAQALTARQASRIEYAIRVVMEAVESWEPKDKLWAVDRLVPLFKREAELMGLDRPSGDTLAASSYVKRVVIVDADPPSPAPVSEAVPA